MPDEVLVMILSLLPLKEAVVTSSFSTRWRFVWCNLTRLNFDGSETFDNIVDTDDMVFLSEQDKYVNQVNKVIQGYNRPKLQDFRIRFNLDYRHAKVIDEWLQFAVNKNVEFLELDLGGKCGKVTESDDMYEYPSSLLKRRWNATVVSLRKLILKSVDVEESTLQDFLTNSPHLEMISIHDSSLYDVDIYVSGRALKLKHFEIVHCFGIISIYLSDLNLTSFTYKGSDIFLHLAHLPKLKDVEINIDRGHEERNNILLGQISSCCPSLQSLSINIYSSMVSSLYLIRL